MARVTGPLMSIDASGTVAGAITFAKWRGRNYVRRHAVPSNPRTIAQLAARAIIRLLGYTWQYLTAPDQATWDVAAAAKKISSFNEYVATNARNWRDSIMPTQASPAALAVSLSACGALTATVSGRQVQLDVAASAPPNNDRWGIAICRSDTTGFTPSASNTVNIIYTNGSDGVAATWTDGPLPPGTYYYNAFGFSRDGTASAASGEDSAVVA